MKDEIDIDGVKYQRVREGPFRDVYMLDTHIYCSRCGKHDRLGGMHDSSKVQVEGIQVNLVLCRDCYRRPR